MNIFSVIILIFIICTFLYSRKKLKKYLKIYNINGLDGVYYYFLNKNFKNTGLNNFIDKKKKLLGIKISKIAKNRILNGPYKNTKILNLGGWSSVDYSSKYLGTYENNVQKKIIYLAKKFKLKNFYYSQFFDDCFDRVRIEKINKFYNLTARLDHSIKGIKISKLKNTYVDRFAKKSDVIKVQLSKFHNYYRNKEQLKKLKNAIKGSSVKYIDTTQFMCGIYSLRKFLNV